MNLFKMSCFTASFALHRRVEWRHLRRRPRWDGDRQRHRHVLHVRTPPGAHLWQGERTTHARTHEHTPWKLDGRIRGHERQQHSFIHSYSDTCRPRSLLHGKQRLIHKKRGQNAGGWPRWMQTSAECIWTSASTEAPLWWNEVQLLKVRQEV